MRQKIRLLSQKLSASFARAWMTEVGHDMADNAI